MRECLSQQKIDGEVPSAVEETGGASAHQRVFPTGTEMTSAACLDWTTATDEYYNYCWWPYEPVASTANKLRPVTLLQHSFAMAGVAEQGRRLVQALQEEIGLFRTVYGVKQFGDRVSWELYFYDYERRERTVSITRVLDCLAPLVDCPVRINERLPYFMFSLEWSDAELRALTPLSAVRMYVGNPGSSVSSGIAYKFTADETRLENFYFFFDAATEREDAAAKIFCSPRVDASQVAIEQILRPELVDCHTICIANKGLADTAYFSGVRIEQLLFFLEWLGYPAETQAFVRRHRFELNHLLFDVGFDFTCDGSNLVIQKSGYYGVF